MKKNEKNEKKIVFFFLWPYMGRNVPTTVLYADRPSLLGHLDGTCPKNGSTNTNQPLEGVNLVTQPTKIGGVN